MYLVWIIETKMRLTEKQINRMLRDLERWENRKEEKRRLNRIKRAKEKAKRLHEIRKAKQAEKEGLIIFPDWFKPYARQYKDYLKFDVKKRFEHVLDYSFEEFRDIFINAKCSYCGINERLGLDRLDNRLGHTKNNTVVCCTWCNLVRGWRYTPEEMKIIGATLSQIHKDRLISG